MRISICIHQHTQFDFNRFNSMESFDMVYWYWYSTVAIALIDHCMIALNIMCVFVCGALLKPETPRTFAIRLLLLLLRLIGLFVENWNRYNKSMIQLQLLYTIILAEIWFTHWKSILFRIQIQLLPQNSNLFQIFLLNSHWKMNMNQAN